MPHSIELINGSILTPFGIRDLLEAVRDYAGDELAQEIESYVSENVEDIDEYEQEFDRMEKESEQTADHHRAVLCDIQYEVDALCSAWTASAIMSTPVSFFNSLRSSETEFAHPSVDSPIAVKSVLAALKYILTVFNVWPVDSAFWVTEFIATPRATAWSRSFPASWRAAPLRVNISRISQ